MNFSALYKAAILNFYFGAETASPGDAPATWYFGLLTTLPADDGTGSVEASGTSYARVAKTNNTTNFAHIGAGAAKVNSNAITFPAPGGSWGSVVGIGVYDAASAGNLRAWGAVSTFTPAVADAPVIPSGTFSITAT